jgi:hypothetical protein
MGRVYQTRARSGSASSTRSQKRNRAISTQVLTAAQVVTIAERPCQGCFLRKEKKPHHVCLRRPNRKACLHCRKAHNKCIEVWTETNCVYMTQVLTYYEVDPGRNSARCQSRPRAGRPGSHWKGEIYSPEDQESCSGFESGEEKGGQES